VQCVEMVDAALEYLVTDKRQDRRLAEAWLARTCKEPALFDACVRAKVLTDVADHVKFANGLVALKERPYIKKEFGESPEHMYRARLTIATKVLKVGDDTSARTDFAAWAYWFRHTNRLYVPSISLYKYCSDIRIDNKEFFTHLRRHGVSRNMYTYHELYDAEMSITRMLSGAQVLGVEFTPSEDCQLDAAQVAAVRGVLTSPYAALQGGAGVGKTTTVAEIVRCFCGDRARVFCLAFTHKAKRCMSKRIEADEEVCLSTIHSFVATWGRPESAALPPRIFVLLDESSMVDVELLGELARVLIRSGSAFQLCFVGDTHQLPPIGRGEFFRHLVAAGTAVHQLTKCYRTDHADLFAAYEAVRAGRMPETSENFTMEVVPTDRDINSRVGALINAGLPEGFQFIAWQNKDVWKVNQWVQASLAKRGLVGPGGWRHLLKGDRVIYKGSNNERLTNSTIGRVTEAHTPRGVTIEWETGATIRHDDVRDINLSYVNTVHSEQGSEHDVVIVPCYEAHKMMNCLDRRWFYTAITRGKKQVIVIATPELRDFVKAPLKALPVASYMCDRPSV